MSYKKLPLLKGILDQIKEIINQVVPSSPALFCYKSMGNYLWSVSGT